MLGVEDVAVRVAADRDGVQVHRFEVHERIRGELGLTEREVLELKLRCELLRDFAEMLLRAIELGLPY